MISNKIIITVTLATVLALWVNSKANIVTL